MTKIAKFLYNPQSGQNSIIDYLDDIIAVYEQRDYILIPHRLNFGPEDEDFLAFQEENIDHILIAGGDGTVNYIVNILKNFGMQTPIAIIPAGTANDFATMLGMPQNVVSACRKILGGEVHKIDLGRAGDRYFVNVFSCGLFTDVSQKTPTVMKNVFGKLAYYFSSIQDLPNFKKLNINLHSEENSFEGSSLIFFVFNGQTAGKMRIAYMSQLDDGLLDVIVIKSDNLVDTLTTIVHFLKRGGKEYPAGIVHFQTNRLYVDSLNNETTDVDGQPGPQFPIEIVCEKQALNIILPRPSAHKTRKRTRNSESIEESDNSEFPDSFEELPSIEPYVE